MNDCELCAKDGGIVLERGTLARVVLVDEPDYPGFCRVVLARHVKEMTDLPPAERGALMELVFRVEAAIRTVVHPAKMNLASLGNLVPHLHWHVIPRREDDPTFPRPIWGETLRPVRRREDSVEPGVLAEALRAALRDSAPGSSTGA